MKTVSIFVRHCVPLRLSASALALICGFSAQAQPQLKETVVTATRVAQPLSDLVADVTIVDRERIERSGATGLADLLGRLPGIEFQRNGGPGSNTVVFVRGAESRFTAVFVDGVRFDSQSTGGATWEVIPLGQIDRIEVLRGPAAAVYGSDALSGVIQIFTKRGENGFAPAVGLGFGTYSTRKLDLSFSGASGAFDYSLGLVDEQSNGYTARVLPTQNPDPDGYISRSANAKLGFQLNKAHRLEATFLTHELNSQYDNGLGKDDRSLRGLNTMGLSWLAQWTGAWSTRASVSDSKDRYETKPSPYLTTTDLRSYLLHNEVRLGEHLVTADLERKEDRLNNAPINKGRSQDGVAVGYGFNNQKHTVQLNARHDEDSEFGGQDTGSMAYGYAFTPQWRATASTGTAFRAPTLYHRFSAYGVSTLQPESSRNVEISLRYAQGSSSVGVVAYRNKVTNLINYVVGSGPCQNGGPPVSLASRGCYANTARAQYSGVTLTGGTTWDAVNLSASLDVQDPRDLGAGKQLARRAKQHGTVTADTRVGRWQLGLEAQFSGERFDKIDNKLVLPGYSLFNLTASTTVARDWTLLARVDNLANAKYELASTYATAGRTFYAGVKWAPQ